MCRKPPNTQQSERILNYVCGSDDDVRLLKSRHCNAVCKGVDMRKCLLWSEGHANWIGFYPWSPFESQPGVLQVCVSQVFFSKDRKYMKEKKESTPICIHCKCYSCLLEGHNWWKMCCAPDSVWPACVTDQVSGGVHEAEESYQGAHVNSLSSSVL